MAFDIFDTYQMLLAIKALDPISTFLRDRYFPCNPATDIFASDKVLVEIMNGDNKMAPFVSPRRGGVTMLRQGYTMKELTPANIAPSRALTMDELKKKMFGEAIMGQLTPAERAQVLALQDAQALDMYISRTEEWMAAEVLLNNGIIMRHIADKGDEYEEMEVRYYEGASNPAVFAPSIPWDQDGADIMGDIAVMASALKKRGLPASELVTGNKVANIIQNDPIILKKLDIKNLNVGGVDPSELPENVTKVARLNCGGHYVDILNYQQEMENESGVMAPIIPDGKTILTAPGAGRMLYGQITQMEADKEYYSYAERRVPKTVADEKSNSRELTLTARPLPAPNNINPWMSAEVL